MANFSFELTDEQLEHIKDNNLLNAVGMSNLIDYLYNEGLIAMPSCSPCTLSSVVRYINTKYYNNKNHEVINEERKRLTTKGGEFMKYRGYNCELKYGEYYCERLDDKENIIDSVVIQNTEVEKMLTILDGYINSRIVV